jgi:hypothetical protein
MIAAYFLKPHGHAEHGGGPMMDRYLKVLLWSLDTRKQALRRVCWRRGRLGWTGSMRGCWTIACG